MAHQNLRAKSPTVLFLILLISVINLPPTVSQPTHFDRQITRTVPITIKVVFVGYEPNTLDIDYMLWSENLPPNRQNYYAESNNATGVIYSFRYEIVFPDQKFRADFAKFLKGIEETAFLYNPWFQREMNNTFYSAQKTEDWLIKNNASFGGFPSSGYTFIFSNMTELPSVTWKQLDNPFRNRPTPHYYQVDYRDLDRFYRIRYREFSVGWGGRTRMWYLDFAAGPEFWTWVNPEALPHIPLQVAIELFKVDIHKEQGKRWLTQLMADYVREATLNLATPILTYPPPIAQKYLIVVNVFDNRTVEERKEVAIQSTIQADLIKKAFADLLPYAQVEAQVKIRNLEDVYEFYQVILESTFIPPSDLNISPFVDIRPVQRYLQKNIWKFVDNPGSDSKQVTLPAFAFAFQSDIYLGLTFKWSFAQGVERARTFFGIALGDVALMSLTQFEFLRGEHVFPRQPRRGIGFTQLVIHEVGHNLGLAHPHEFGFLGDFVSSAMSYYAWDYTFSQFDKDTLHRAHADQRFLKTLQNLALIGELGSGRILFQDTKRRLERVNALIQEAESKYLDMNYPESYRLSTEAERISQTLLEELPSLPLSAAINFLASFITGIVVGFVILLAVLQRLRPSESHGKI